MNFKSRNEKRMKKWRITAAFFIANLLLCTSVFARSTDFTNSDSSNWDNPVKGTLESYKVENKILSTRANVQWNSDQIKQYQSQSIISQFYPSLVFKSDPSDKLRSKMMFTNLPGAKFTRKKATDSTGEEIKLSILRTSDVIANKPYAFYTAWLHTGEGDPTVTLQSLQGYAQPNGTQNDLPKTDDTISTVYLNDAETLDMKYQNLILPESLVSPFNQYTDGDLEKKKKVKSYSFIDSKEKLDQYKIKSEKLLKATPENTDVQFAITFNKPVSVESLDKIAQEYHLSVSQIYAAGITEKKEEFTVSWFDTNKEVTILMDIGHPFGFAHFSITELEGTAKVEDLERMSSYPELDFVEIEEDGRTPTGVHWLNERYSE